MAGRVAKNTVSNLEKQLQVEIGTPVLLPPPIIEGGSDEDDDAILQPTVPISSVVSQRPLPSYPMLSWPPRSSNIPLARMSRQRQPQLLADNVDQQQQQQQQQQEEEGELRQIAVRQIAVRQWRPHPANESFETPSPNLLLGHRRREIDEEDETTADEEHEDETTTSKSLSFSHSVLPTGESEKSEDYQSIFQFVNTAHDLGWSISNQKAKKDEISRTLDLRPPSAAVAENNVYVMQQICTKFERQRNKT